MLLEPSYGKNHADFLTSPINGIFSVPGSMCTHCVWWEERGCVGGAHLQAKMCGQDHFEETPVNTHQLQNTEY